MTRALLSFLIATCWLTTARADETKTFGTGEVTAATLQVGDRVDVTWRAVDRRSRSRMAEGVGTVVEVGETAFVLQAEQAVTIPYEAVIRLDRTRSNAWMLDPGDALLSQAALVGKYLEGRELAGLEGTWVWDDASYELAVVGGTGAGIARYDYVGLVLASTVEGWQPGEIKLLLKETATEGTWSGTVVLDDRSRYGTTVEIEDGRVMEARLPTPRSRRLRSRLIHKTYPIPEEEAPDSAVTEPDRKIVSGSGFFVTPDIVATANALVDDADSITVRLAGRAYPVTVRARDRRNGIALLAVTGPKPKAGAGPVIPLAVGDPGSVTEGERIVASAFVSPRSPRPTVFEGVVNSLFGPDDDLTRFTVSVQAHPGGPLIDSANRVVGLILPADTTHAEGTVTAVKADLLSALLRLSAVTVAAEPDSLSSNRLDTALIASMARSAVVSVEAVIRR